MVIAAASIVTTAMAAGITASALAKAYTIATVLGPSMEPTLHTGDRLLIRRHAVVELGDIVVLRGPQGCDPNQRDLRIASTPSRHWLVKRVAGLPGDPIPRDRVPALRNVPGNTIPGGAIVVLGDNAAISEDSRTYGYAFMGQVLGVAVRRLGGAGARHDVPRGH